MKQASILRLSLTLAIITAVVVAALSFANYMTKDIIAERAQQAQFDAMCIVFESVVDDSSKITFEEDKTNSTDALTLFKATADGNVIGYAANVVTNGYGGAIGLIVGVDTQNKVSGVQIVSSSETPGLGAKANEPEFTSQYIGKSGELAVTKSGTPAEAEIVAITGATITSKAVTDAVNITLAAVAGLM